MKKTTMFAGGAILIAMLPLLGCQSRYASNRYADFADIFQLGAGVTAENHRTGMVPPSLGLYFQATEFVNLGAMHFDGVSAEIDGRGQFAGNESRTRFGLGPWQRLRIDQDYDEGSYNYFKYDGLWTKRMNSRKGRFWHKPAKELEYKFWAEPTHTGYPAMHRGWQYWENINLELSICEPFITHHGVNVRLGFDPSEIFDFILGFTTLDFKQDDLTQAEYDESLGFDERQQAKKAARQAAKTNGGPPPPVTGEGVDEGRIPGTEIIYFDYDKSNIRPDQMDNVEKNLAFMKANPDLKVTIVGHCDERGTNEYNFSLGERRAKTVMQYLIRNGIDSSRMRIISKGEEEPADPGHSEAAWARNRRAVFLSFSK